MQPWKRWLGYFALWTLLGLVFATQLFLAEQRFSAQPASWWQALRSEMLDWYLWGVLALAVRALARRFRIDRANWERVVPIHFGASLVVSAVLTGMVPYTELNLPAPMAHAMEQIGAPWWVRVSIDLGAVLGLGSVILVMLLGQSRVFFSMSRDGLLGKWAGKVHPTFRTPYLSTIYTGIAVGLATGFLPLQLLGQLVNIGTLLAFVLVCAGVWILRTKRPDLERPFKTPLVPFVPIMGILCCFGLMLTLPRDTWLRLAVWLLIGFAIYFGYSRRHSVLRRASVKQ